MKMLLLILLLSFISSLCLIKCEERLLSIELRVNEENCILFKPNKVHKGDNVTVLIRNNDYKINSFILNLPGQPNNPLTATNQQSITILNVTEKHNGNWKFDIDYQIPTPYNEYTPGKYIPCQANLIIEPDKTEGDKKGFDLQLPYLIVIVLLSLIIIAEACVIWYLKLKVNKLPYHKGLGPSQEKTPQCNEPNKADRDIAERDKAVRYISGPISKKIDTPIIESRQSEIYEVPDITKGGNYDQDTLKSNISINLRPRMPLPEEKVYAELPEFTDQPAVVFQPPVLPKPPKKIGNIKEKQDKLLPDTRTPPKPTITPNMLNRPTKQLVTQPPPHAIGRKKEPILPPLKHNETSPTPVTRNELSPVPGRRIDPNPPLQRNNGHTLPSARSNNTQCPIPGPSTLKKTLKPVLPTPAPSMPIPGPSTLKPLKPLSRTPVRAQTPPLEQQVDQQRLLQQRDSTLSDDDKEWDYEPLPQYNIYNI